MELNQKPEVAVQTVEKKARKNASPLLADSSIQFKSMYLNERPDVLKTTPKRRSSGRKPKRSADSYKKYQSIFDKKTYRQFSYKCNAYKEEDITWILDNNSIGVKEYITGLIREDMKAHPEKACYQIPKEVKDRVDFINEATTHGMNLNEAIKAYKEHSVK